MNPKKQEYKSTPTVNNKSTPTVNNKYLCGKKPFERLSWLRLNTGDPTLVLLCKIN